MDTNAHDIPTSVHRTRQEILSFLFRPLLSWFSSGVVGSVFDTLRVRDDSSYILKCFGEWFLSLSVKEIQERCLNHADSPMRRFLQDTVELEINSTDDKLTAMDALISLCEESTDLVRAFMLAALAHEVQLHISRQKEESIFGKGDTSNTFAVVKQAREICEHLESLLRKLRICLFVSLRLHGSDLAPFPLTVKNLEKEKDYSVFRWIALDELKISHNHVEIVTLETACALSSHRLNPFSSEADEPLKFNLLHESCYAQHDRTNAVRNPDKSGSLLLFFAPYNHPEYLAAHRALLLAFEWIEDPTQNEFLRDCIAALNSLPRRTESVSVAYAVLLDIWSRAIAAIYRARLVGFSDIPEVAEDCVASLLENREWLTEFGRMALKVLMLLRENSPDRNESGSQSKLDCSALVMDKTWPPPAPDHTLELLIKKAQKVESTAVEMHMIVVCALLYSDDKRALSDCVPALDDCFNPTSLFTPMNASQSRDARQESFLCEAIVSIALEHNSGPVDSFKVLGELELLASQWGFDQKWIRTTFLISMYELGKDSDVDDLMIAAVSQILPRQLIVAGVNIVCRRLDFLLIKMKSSSDSGARNIMGLLDAELCEWIHDRCESSKPLIALFRADVDIEATQILAIRLLSLGSSSNADAEIRARIHALSVVSGILAREIEGTPS